MRRFDCYPDDFLAGTIGIGPVLGWAYTRLFMKIYADGGPIEFNPQKLKFLLEMRSQDVCKVVEKLEALGKLTVENGLIHNRRASEEIEKFGKMNPEMKPKWSRNDGQMKLHFNGHNSEKANDISRARAPASPSPSPLKKEKERKDRFFWEEDEEPRPEKPTPEERARVKSRYEKLRKEWPQ